VPGGILVEDKNYIDAGAGTFDGTEIVDLNGRKLTIDHTALNGAVFIDSSTGEPGELHIRVPGGVTASLDGVSLFGNMKVVKEGAGCLLMRPQEIAVACAEGRLDIGGKLPIHRWSFTDGSLADSGIVGGKTAVAQTANAGRVTYAENAVTFSGGKKGDSYLNLGTDVIPSSGDVTIELWGRRNEAKHQWASMFSLGVNGENNNSFRMAWSNPDAGDGKTDMVYLKHNGDVFFVNNSMSPYTVGRYYHISMRIVQNADGSAVFTWSKRNVETGAIEKTYTANVAKDKGWSLAKYKGNPFVLNHGYDNDDEAASYDEVRIWAGALSDAQLTLNAKLGPDRVVATPDQGTCCSLEVMAGATLATPADGVACTRLSGAGTLAAQSALVVEEALDIAGAETGTLTVFGDLTVSRHWLWDGVSGRASDRIAGTGTLDLTRATFVPRFTGGATGVFQMADGVTITGYDQMTLPSSGNFTIRYTAGRLTLVRPGFAIRIR
jgi:hypothetical protein